MFASFAALFKIHKQCNLVNLYCMKHTQRNTACRRLCYFTLTDEERFITFLTFFFKLFSSVFYICDLTCVMEPKHEEKKFN